MAKVTKIKASSNEDKTAKTKSIAKAGVSKLKGGASGFMDFIKEQNIVGLAIGLVLGTQAGATVNSLINNVIMPPLGLLLGSKDGLRGWTIALGDTGAAVSLGAFLNDLINFLVLALVIYVVIKLLKLDIKK